ncbi:hypothetical protein PO124_18165 [Bacillus licheniformis]|nr:hypothetical protein [Bacillus licheniformis]
MPVADIKVGKATDETDEDEKKKPTIIDGAVLLPATGGDRLHA